MFVTEIIFIFSRFSFDNTISFSLDFGIITCFNPASIAASIFDVIPPIAKTFPLTDRDPVIAVSCLIGTFVKAEMIAVATAIEAESPSTPVSTVCRNCM